MLWKKNTLPNRAWHVLVEFMHRVFQILVCLHWINRERNWVLASSNHGCLRGVYLTSVRLWLALHICVVPRLASSCNLPRVAVPNGSSGVLYGVTSGWRDIGRRSFLRLPTASVTPGYTDRGEGWPCFYGTLSLLPPFPSHITVDPLVVTEEIIPGLLSFSPSSISTTAFWMYSIHLQVTSNLPHINRE